MFFCLQSEVRRVYRDLVESKDAGFAGFDLESGYVGIFICNCDNLFR